MRDGLQRLAAALIMLATATSVLSAQSHPKGDSAFAALQERGQHYMGVDQYTSTHHFLDLADGGRIVLVRDSTDTTGISTIRMHLQHITSAFSQGDFQIPMLVHDTTVPGVGVMARKHDAIRYVFAPLTGGGQVTMSTSDPEALKAIHAFLAFQRREHKTNDDMNHDMH
jgi:hypothetical protein